MVQKRKARLGQAEIARPRRQMPADLPCPAMHAEGAVGNEPIRGEGVENELDQDDADDDQFDPSVVDFLGDFGLDDDESVPDRNDFWLDGLDESFD